ncbi:hypothetical protein ASG84_15735 [Rhodococcus sp. Leaf278]|nr:hypothetical protein ASG84_15735 [Rhodococcus sp. Leaf278]
MSAPSKNPHSRQDSPASRQRIPSAPEPKRRLLQADAYPLTAYVRPLATDITRWLDATRARSVP